LRLSPPAPRRKDPHQHSRRQSQLSLGLQREERHFFRDEGWKTKPSPSAAAGIAALVSGDVDFSGAGGRAA
jgi:hypothetical protein